jgi:GNAT superfamily N-acetyltransferase
VRQGNGQVAETLAQWQHFDVMQIRDAVVEDAPAACQVLRQSIEQLCAADHRNDPVILTRWLSNKTPANIASWIARADNSLLLAVEAETIMAVGAVTDAGEITLNYVAPNARFRGASRILLAALEARAAQRGNPRCTLFSTETAHRFYRARGYVDDGPPDRKYGTAGGYPMAKALAAQNL